jgi:cytochrome c-type biogenesis protein
VDLTALQHAVEHAGIAATGVGFFAGLLFSVNPVAIAAIPVSLAYVVKARERREAIVFGALFIAGMILTHVVLGVVAGVGGQWVESLHGRGWGLFLGPLLILLGLVWPGWLRLPLPSLGFRAKRPSGASGAFLLGIPFSIAICPVCTPALLVLLGVAASLGSPLTGGVLLLAFALGRAIPVALGAIAIGWLKSLRRLSKFVHAFEVLGGLALIVSGVYMLNAYFFWIPSLAA